MTTKGTKMKNSVVNNDFTKIVQDFLDDDKEAK